MKAAHRSNVVKNAAIYGPPDISAVFAAAGLDKYPATPQIIRKTPNPKNQNPVFDAFEFISAQVMRLFSLSQIKAT